jgi:TPR repeat protein
MRFVIAAVGLCASLLCQAQDDYDECSSRFGDDQRLEVETLEEFARGGDTLAQYCLAVMYHDGKGVERDANRAVDWYTRAAQRGHVKSQYWLCLMYRDGLGIDVDTLESFYWCKRAVKHNHAGALYELGQWYYHGPNRNEGHSFVNAYVWFSRALHAGETDAAEMIQLLESQMTELQLLVAKKLSDTDAN